MSIHRDQIELLRQWQRQKHSRRFFLQYLATQIIRGAFSIHEGPVLKVKPNAASNPKDN